MNRTKDVFFTSSDVYALFKNHKKKLLAIFFFSFLFVLAFFVTKSPMYKAEALFQIVDEEKNDAGIFEKMPVKMGLSEKKLPIGLMLSKKIIVPIIKQLGLQVYIKERDLKEELFTNARHNFFVEIDSASFEKKGFSFSQIEFTGRIKKYYYLRFIDQNHFEILDLEKKVLSAGKVDSKCTVENVSFVLDRVPDCLSTEYFYPITFIPIKNVYESLLKKLSIEPDKNADSLLQIRCKYNNPFIAQQIVNGIMLSYKNFLQEEAESISDMEMDYLQKKRTRLFGDLERLLNKAVAFQKKQIENQNPFPIEEKMEKILEPFNKSKEKLTLINAKLKSLSKESHQYLPTYFTELKKIQSNIEELKGEKELYALNLSSKKLDKNPLFSYLGMNFSEKIKTDSNDEIRLIDAEMDRLKKNESVTKSLEKIKLLSLRRKLLEKRAQIEAYDSTLEGIDAKTAKTLLAQSYLALDEVQSNILKLRELKKQVEMGCELISLSGRIKNPLLQDMIKGVHKLSLKLKDKSSLTTKEEERCLQELECLKKAFVESLDQQEQLEELMQEKQISRIKKLNITIQDRLDQQIALSNLKKKELISSYHVELSSEKQALEKHLDDLAKEMSLIPDQWKLEKELKLKTKMVLSTLDSLGKVLEEKSFLSQLKKVQSKPVDKAELYFLQERPLLFFLSFAFALFCTLFSFLVLFLKRCLYGFSLSKELLQIYGQDVLGSFSDENKVLYETANFIIGNLKEKEKIVSLIQNSKEYVKKLCSVFMKRGYKVIIVDGSGYLEKKGWIDHLENNTPLSIEKTKFGHFLYMGKRKNTLLEHISSLAFLNMMHKLKKEYDLILLACDANPSSLEARATLAFSDQVILTITKETLHEVESFLHWSRKGKKLGFLIR